MSKIHTIGSIVNPIGTFLIIVVAGVLIAQRVGYESVVITVSIVLGAIVGFHQLVNAGRRYEFDESYEEKIKEGQRKLVMELFGEDFEDDGK